ncbi:MAG: negative regulator of septation ring formation [Holdemanella sp.]|nr:negative regulator of septation ring formation [Holdemanella sp.]
MDVLKKIWKVVKDVLIKVGKFLLNLLKELYKLLRKNLSTEMMIYIAIAILVLILLIIVIKTIRNSRAKKRLQDLEVEVNELRNSAITYKYNKATAFGRSNKEALEQVQQLKPKYELCVQNIKTCEHLFTDAVEFLDSRKIKKAQRSMDDLEEILQDAKDRLQIVSETLDNILQREGEVREQANAVKERLSSVKKVFQDNRASFYDAAPYFDALLVEIEDGFTNFEEWMYASEFNKAQEELDKLSNRLNETSSRIAGYPGLYEQAKVILPRAIAEVKQNVASASEKGVDISYLECDKKIAEVEAALMNTINLLDQGAGEAVQPTLDTISDAILEVQDNVEKEKQAYEEIQSDLTEILGIVDGLYDELKQVEVLYANTKDRFGLDDWTKSFIAANAQIQDLKAKRDHIEAVVNSDQPNQSVVHEYRVYADEVQNFYEQIKKMKQMLLGANADESRAKKQIIKLQLILNEVRLNVATRNLPSISGQFDEDINEGERLVNRVRVILDHTPLDVATLNADLQEAIDFIYKLYNNANNLIGVAIMVENAIVFGNRFRSSYPQMDSELTHAELCFHNGEYTKALKIAIQAIENTHPGIYEKLIAKKDPAVMNQVQ